MAKKYLKAKTKELEGELYALLSAFGSGGYVLINKYAYAHHNLKSLDYASTFVTIAGVIGLLSLLINLATKRRPAMPKRWPLLIQIGASAGLAVGLVVIGQKYTFATNVAFLGTITVVTTAIISQYLLKQSIHRSKLPWIALLLASVYLAVIGFTSYHPRSGDWFVIAATVLYGLSNTLTRIAMDKNSPGIVRDVRFIVAGLLFGLVILFSPSVSFVTSAGILPYLAAISFWSGILCFNRAVKLIGPSLGIVINNAQLVLVLLVSVPLLNEHLTLHKVIGAVFVLLAIQKISSRR